jgi:hypothetical protein
LKYFLPSLSFFSTKMKCLNLASNFPFSLIITKSSTNSKLFWNLHVFKRRNVSGKKFMIRVFWFYCTLVFYNLFMKVKLFRQNPLKNRGKSLEVLCCPLEYFLFITLCWWNMFWSAVQMKVQSFDLWWGTLIKDVRQILDIHTYPCPIFYSLCLIRWSDFCSDTYLPKNQTSFMNVPM